MVKLGEYVEIGDYIHEPGLDPALANDFARLQRHLSDELSPAGGVRINLSPYDSGTVLNRIRAATNREPDGGEWVITFYGVLCCLDRKSTEVFKYQFVER